MVAASVLILGGIATGCLSREANAAAPSHGIFLQNPPVAARWFSVRLYESGDWPRWMNAHGVNGDGRLDLVSVGHGQISVLPNASDGTFGPRLGSDAGEDPRNRALGEFNSDEKIDVVISPAYEGAFYVVFGRGDGTFGGGTRVEATDVRLIAVGDFNLDANSDVASAQAMSIEVFLGQGDASFLPPSRYSGGASNSFISVGDFNGDGRPDRDISDASIF